MNHFLNLISLFNFVFIFVFTIPMLAYFAGWNLVGLIINSESMKHYSARVMVGIDQSWNAALRGEEDETVSSRLGRALKSGKPKWGARLFAYFVNFIFLVIAQQKNHCLESIEEKWLNGAPSDEKWSFIKDE